MYCERALTSLIVALGRGVTVVTIIVYEGVWAAASSYEVDLTQSGGRADPLIHVFE